MREQSPALFLGWNETFSCHEQSEVDANNTFLFPKWLKFLKLRFPRAGVGSSRLRKISVKPLCFVREFEHDYCEIGE